MPSRKGTECSAKERRASWSGRIPRRTRKRTKKNKLYRTRVTIRREGEVVAPVEVAVRFENGEIETRSWDGEYRWVKFEFVKKSRPASVVVDPDRKLFADANWTNNSWVPTPRLATTAKWTSALLFWAQQLLQTLSLFA